MKKRLFQATVFLFVCLSTIINVNAASESVTEELVSSIQVITDAYFQQRDLSLQNALLLSGRTDTVYDYKTDLAVPTISNTGITSQEVSELTELRTEGMIDYIESCDMYLLSWQVQVGEPEEVQFNEDGTITYEIYEWSAYEWYSSDFPEPRSSGFGTWHTLTIDDLSVIISDEYFEGDTSGIDSRKDIETEQPLQFETASELFSYWSINGYGDTDSWPPYLCGVWTSNQVTNELTFAVTKDEAGELGKQEILDLVLDDTTVNFTYQDYTRNELEQAQADVCEYVSHQLDLSYTSGIDEINNRVHVTVATKNADVENSEEVEKLISDYCARNCGDMVELKFVENIDLVNHNDAEAQSSEKLKIVLGVALVIGVILAIGIFARSGKKPRV